MARCLTARCRRTRHQWRAAERGRYDHDTNLLAMRVLGPSEPECLPTVATDDCFFGRNFSRCYPTVRFNQRAPRQVDRLSEVDHSRVSEAVLRSRSPQANPELDTRLKRSGVTLLE